VLGNEDPQRVLEDIIVAAASHETTIEQITEWFRLRIEKMPPP
jgi:hypothetical protein